MLRIEKMLEKNKQNTKHKSKCTQTKEKAIYWNPCAKTKTKTKKIKLNKTKYLKNYSVWIFIDWTDGQSEGI